MPKKIENVTDRIKEAARRQVQDGGYSAMTMRSIAYQCGVGIGTLYNYFKSKDDIIVEYLLDDWKLLIKKLDDNIVEDTEFTDAVRIVYSEFKSYTSKHIMIFSDKVAEKIYHLHFASKHVILKNQVKSYFLPYCEANKLKNYDLIADIMAESLIAYCIEGTPVDELINIYLKLLK